MRFITASLNHHLVQQKAHRRLQCQLRYKKDYHGSCARITNTIRGFFVDKEKSSMDKRKDDVIKFFVSRTNGHDKRHRALQPVHLL